MTTTHAFAFRFVQSYSFPLSQEHPRGAIQRRRIEQNKGKELVYAIYKIEQIMNLCIPKSVANVPSNACVSAPATVNMHATVYEQQNSFESGCMAF